MKPIRGLVRPAIQGALAGLLLALAAWGGLLRWFEARSRDEGVVIVRGCGGCPAPQCPDCPLQAPRSVP